ncbi:hypothetical protein CPB83DRAFT_625811 [Crepidotus variabilis]|uniref:Nephrocystin 3-like N-terminal domain-containing protein n=1 Tax=Crepidotus variabilis TaxID=179855 RepID=A0A9P6EPW7_9AGAR|nr:hypothetical protein CPB83DRAFT_625811 [Crepidotus variabilis]
MIFRSLSRLNQQGLGIGNDCARSGDCAKVYGMTHQCTALQVTLLHRRPLTIKPVQFHPPNGVDDFQNTGDSSSSSSFASTFPNSNHYHSTYFHQGPQYAGQSQSSQQVHPWTPVGPIYPQPGWNAHQQTYYPYIAYSHHGMPAANPYHEYAPNVPFGGCYHPEVYHPPILGPTPLTVGHQGTQIRPSCPPSTKPSRSYNLGNQGNFKAKDSHFNIIEGNQIINSADDRNAIEALDEHCAPSARLNSKERFDAVPCARETRKSVLDLLNAWIQRPDSLSLLAWLFGPAGAGKSSIAQSLALEAEKSGMLAATFFFSGTSSIRDRADGDRLFPTLVSELIETFPELKPFVVAAITRRSFFGLARRAIFDKLLVDPLRMPDITGNSELGRVEAPFRLKGKARLVVIDGLDECNKNDVQEDIIKIIAEATKHLSHPFRFLIVSRPERHISQVFNQLAVKDADLLHIDLSKDKDADDDIERFFRLEFKRICMIHLEYFVDNETWPLPKDIKTLVQRASQQFIYASTVMKFIETNTIHDSHDTPQSSLKLVLDLDSAQSTTKNPFAPLDDLYTFVFSKVGNEHLDTVARAFSLLVFPSTSMMKARTGDGKESLSLLERCLGLQTGKLKSVLAPLFSLLSFGKRREQNIQIHHASIKDFLKSSSRSSRLKFRVSQSLASETLALYWCGFVQQRPGLSDCNHPLLLECIEEANLSQRLKEAIISYCDPASLLKTGDFRELISRVYTRFRTFSHKEESSEAKSTLHLCYATEVVQLLEATAPIEKTLLFVPRFVFIRISTLYANNIKKT